LICLVGESFRLGTQGTRLRDVEEAYEPQKSACASVVDFMDQMKVRRGVDCDVFISSYSTRWEADLKAWYGDRLVGSIFLENLVGLDSLVANAKQNIDFGAYDFVLVLRIDVFLKPYFSDIFDPEWNKIMYPSVIWIGFHLWRGRPGVAKNSDMMAFVPRKFADLPIFLNHGAYSYYHDAGLKDSVGFMLDTFHDSDSRKDYNPLYYLVCRPGTNLWHGLGYSVGPDFNPAYVGTRSFPDWSPRLMLKHGQRNVCPDGMWEWWCKKPNDRFRFNSLMRLSEFEDACGKIEFHDNKSQRYWKIEKESIVIMDENKKVFSKLEKIDNFYLGSSEEDEKIKFMMKKIIPDEWRSI
jgi:hypothetical protein